MATLGHIIELGHHEELAHDGLQTLCGVRAGWEGGFRLIDESANQQPRAPAILIRAEGMIHWMKSAVEQIVHLEKTKSAMIPSTSFILAWGVKGVEKGKYYFKLFNMTTKILIRDKRYFWNLCGFIALLKHTSYCHCVFIMYSYLHFRAMKMPNLWNITYLDSFKERARARLPCCPFLGKVILM